VKNDLVGEKKIGLGKRGFRKTRRGDGEFAGGRKTRTPCRSKGRLLVKDTKKSPTTQKTCETAHLL